MVSFTQFIIDSVFSLITLVLLLRVWMQLARVDFYNPFSQAIVRFTQPIVGPLRRIIPSFGAIDTASLILAYGMTVLKISLIFLVLQQGFTLFIPTLLGSVLTLIKSAGKLVFWILLLRALMSWISQGRNPVEYVMIQLTEPFLVRIRRLLPDTGGLDFSVMIAMFILIALNYLGADLSGRIGYLIFWIDQWF